MKKIIVAFLALVLLTTMPVACLAESMDSENGDKAIPKAKVEAMTFLGDSIATGYGLEGYDENSDNAEILSYANLTASYYGLTLGENCFNYAKNGAKSSDLLLKLTNELSEDERANIAKSDVIVVSIGGNDLLGIFYTHMAEFLELGANASVEQGIVKLFAMTEDELKDLDKKAENFYKNKKAEIEAVAEQAGENISYIYDELKTISPDAQIYIQSVYNPASELPQYTALSIVNEKIFSNMIDALNSEIFEAANEKGMYKIDVFSEFTGRKEDCTNIADFDVHPNTYGHSIIADALQITIDNVYDRLSSGNADEFNEGEFPWIWFAVSAAVIIVAVPVVIFVVKKSSGAQN